MIASENKGSSESFCLNCNSVLSGPFCASCGQEKHHTDPTLREFLRETTEELFQWDGKLFRSLKTLFLKPGLLTVDFIEGRRVRWLRPLRLYLICSLAFFVSKPLVEVITGHSVRELVQITIKNPQGTSELTPEQRREIAEGLPAKIFGIERLERAAANSARFNQEFDEAFPKAMFLLLPLFALLTNVAWRRYWRRYPAHLYLALHIHSAWFGTLAIVTIAAAFIPESVASGLALFAVFYIAWYVLSVFRRVFDQSWIRTIAKALTVAVVYSVCFFFVSILLLAYALMNI